MADTHRVGPADQRVRAGTRMTTTARRWWLLTAAAVAVAGWLPAQASAAATVSVVLTSQDLSRRLSPQPGLSLSPAPPPSAGEVIRVDDSARLQRFAGVGGAMTDSSAWLLNNLNPDSRRYWLWALFSPAAAHLNLIRIPIGASDFTAFGRPYTYDAARRGRSDPQLRFFSIVHDYSYVLPVLQAALGENPAARVMASLWSAPAWMKVNHALDDEGGAGRLRGDMYRPLARYLVKFLRAYAAAGVPVSAVAPQNEPGQDTTYPGGNLSEGAEASFIGTYLAPALRAAHLHAGIYGYDFNWSASPPPYAAALATDPAAQGLSGLAWHCYFGNPAVMSSLHQLSPTLDQVVSECSPGLTSFSTSELLIASFRNWATAVALWNLALTPAGGPVQTPNTGCQGCTGVLSVDPRTGTVQPTRDYYELAQVGHYVQPGAVRLGSNTFVNPEYLYLATPGLDDVAFQNPDGQKVLIAYNSSSGDQRFAVEDGGRYFSYDLAPSTTATFTW